MGHSVFICLMGYISLLTYLLSVQNKTRYLELASRGAWEVLFDFVSTLPIVKSISRKQFWHTLSTLSSLHCRKFQCRSIHGVAYCASQAQYSALGWRNRLWMVIGFSTKIPYASRLYAVALSACRYKTVITVVCSLQSCVQMCWTSNEQVQQGIIQCTNRPSCPSRVAVAPAQC